MNVAFGERVLAVPPTDRCDDLLHEFPVGHSGPSSSQRGTGSAASTAITGLYLFAALATVFVLGILLCLALILYLTVVVSSLMRQNLRLAQDVALLRHRLERLAAPPSQSSRA